MTMKCFPTLIIKCLISRTIKCLFYRKNYEVLIRYVLDTFYYMSEGMYTPTQCKRGKSSNNTRKYIPKNFSVAVFMFNMRYIEL